MKMTPFDRSLMALLMTYSPQQLALYVRSMLPLNVKADEYTKQMLGCIQWTTDVKYVAAKLLYVTSRTWKGTDANLVRKALRAQFND